jgi:hypothetical protein
MLALALLAVNKMSLQDALLTMPSLSDNYTYSSWTGAAAFAGGRSPNMHTTTPSAGAVQSTT